jgi:hypothetical protein
MLLFSNPESSVISAASGHVGSFVGDDVSVWEGVGVLNDVLVGVCVGAEVDVDAAMGEGLGVDERVLDGVTMRVDDGSPGKIPAIWVSGGPTKSSIRLLEESTKKYTHAQNRKRKTNSKTDCSGFRCMCVRC